jgi:UPF0755 protein
VLIKKIVWGVVVCMVVVSAAVFYLWHDFQRFAHSPLDEKAADQVFTIAPGQHFKAVAESLNAKSLTASAPKLQLLARLKGWDRQVQAGEYQLSAAMSPLEMLDAMVTGKVLLIRVTIPEGFTLTQIAQAVEAAGLSSADDIMAAARQAALLQRLGVASANAEGYLFPDTYLFARNTSADEVVAAMVSRFEAVYTAEFHSRADELGLTRHEVVTLASIVEKESGNVSEQPRIASVFHNRLGRGMRLESDPTVIFGLGDAFDGNLTRQHLVTPNPYNTYTMAGLPPGPIASPGETALKAVLFPEDSSYLFFVSKNDGSHYFSKTYAEHNRAVRRYQLSN